MTLILLSRTFSKSTASLPSNFAVTAAISYSAVTSLFTRTSSFSFSSIVMKSRKSLLFFFMGFACDSVHYLLHNCFHVVKLKLALAVQRDQGYAIYHR